MTRAEDRLLQWLRDAHAMEMQAEQMLSAEASRIENYPQLKARIQEHLEETRNQARRIENCIKARDAEPSGMKDVGGKLMAMAQGMAGMFAGDEVIKGSLASYTFEHMEICSYRILIAAAEAVGDRATASVCAEILREEEAMAEWLARNVAPLTREYLDRDESPHAQAKR